MHAIAVAGHSCVDLRPHLDAGAQLAPGRLIEVGPLTMSLGGPVGNTGRDLALLGADLRVATNVGPDALGEFVRRTLSDDPRTTEQVTVIPGASTSYSLILEPAGLDRTIWHNVGANAAFDGRALDLDGLDLLHLGYPSLLPALLADDGTPLCELLSRARAAGVTTSVDLAVVDPASPAGRLDWQQILARVVAQTDVLTPSLDDLTSALHIEEPYSVELVEHLLARLLDWGAAVAAVSAGAHGLFIRTATPARLAAAGRALADRSSQWADRRLHQPPVRTGEPATTNGAGDASTAGLLFAIAVGAELDQAALLATACAAVVLSGGATSPSTVRALRPELAGLFDTVPSFDA
jgi:sugar/nucleoside kinase (ribokinase family)